MKMFKVNGRRIAAKTISDAVEAYKAKRINLDDASASGTAELTDIINDLLQKKKPLDINEKVDVNGKRVKGQIRIFWNGGEIWLGFTPKSGGDFAMLGNSSSVSVPVDHKTKMVKRSDVNKAAQAIFEFADKQNETKAKVANEKPKLVGYKLEYIEGEQTGPRKRMLNKLVDFDDMVRFLIGEDDAFRSSGKRGYDKAYVDVIYSIGGKKYRVHGSRFYVGNGDVRNTLKREIGFAEREIEYFRKTGYSNFVKEGDSIKDSAVDFKMLLANERQAVEDYRKAISQTTDAKLLTVLSHILKEETEHIEELEAARKGVYEDKGLMDAEAVIYQVTTSQDKMGRLHTEYFSSADEVLRKHKGRIDPSSGHPRLDGFVGPFSNGIKSGKKVLLYEDKNTYLSMDSKAKTAELKSDSLKAKDGIWTLPDTEEKYNKFKAIIKRRYEPKDVKKLTSELYRIWGYDELFDDLEDARDSGDIAYILKSYAKDLHKYLAANKADPKLVAKAKAELG